MLSTVFADRKSPIAYGYDETMAVYFNQSPLIQVAAFGGPGGGGGGQPPAGRASGRGSETDPDVIQGRPPLAPAGTPNPDQAAQLALQLPPPEMRPRVVLRFAPEKELFVSGEIASGAELAGKPAVLDVPVGKGHVVMFANNPMWRHETNGSFELIFNAMLNFDNLGAGRVIARPATGRPGDDILQDQ